jgi:hypothetical protein
LLSAFVCSKWRLPGKVRDYGIFHVCAKLEIVWILLLCTFIAQRSLQVLLYVVNHGWTLHAHSIGHHRISILIYLPVLQDLPFLSMLSSFHLDLTEDVTFVS